MKVSIILPTYNERDNIIELIAAIHAALARFESPAPPLQGDGSIRNFCYEIIVIDDNSPDGTADIVRTVFGDYDYINVHVRRTERGLATAIRHGIEQATGDIIVCMDTDFNHDPAVIPQMIKFLDFYDMVIGSRFVMRGGMEDSFRQFASAVYNFGIRIIFGTPVHENLSGFFAIYRSKLMTMDFEQIFYGYGDYFIRLIMVAWQRGYNMLEVPVFYRLRKHGHSKTQFVSTLATYTNALFILRMKLWLGRMD